MRALVCKKLGSTQNMVLEQRDDLEPGKGQVLIDVRGAGVNFPDILTVEGKYQFKPPLPFIPGTEVSGVISEVGEGISAPDSSTWPCDQSPLSSCGYVPWTLW